MTSELKSKTTFSSNFDINTIECNTIRNKKISYIKTDNCIGYFIKNGKFWEDWMIKYISKFYVNGTNMIDIGANIGTTSLMMSEILSENNYIYTFEPIYSNVTLKNILDNNLQNKIKLYEYGLGNHNYSLEVDEINYNNTKNFGATSILELVNTNTTKTFKINIASLDYFNLDNVSLIKIDVENMEIFVLEGAYNLIEKCKPNILIETHMFEQLINSKIFEKLKLLGYQIEVINEGSNDFILYI